MRIILLPGEGHGAEGPQTCAQGPDGSYSADSALLGPYRSPVGFQKTHIHQQQCLVSLCGLNTNCCC